MLSKIAQAGIDITFKDLFLGFKGIIIHQEGNFIKAISDYLPSRHVFLVNSGTAAFYIILQALKSLSSKKEVILPAYTAPAVVLPVLKANLKPVLCDISMADFNIDLNLLPEVITENTLCVVPTHLFGIAIAGIENLKQRMPDIFVIEDCAQSIGSKIGEKNTGSFCDIGFLSFNRGKSLPTYGGGCIFTNSQELAEEIRTVVGKLGEQGSLSKFILPFKMTAFSLAIRPRVYGILYPVISRFKDNEVPEKFFVERYTDFQAGVGLSLLKKIDEFSERRYQNGTRLINALADIKDIIVPTVAKKTRPAFNRLPVVFKELKRREMVEEVVWKAGFDTSHMYLKPLHHIFDLGYKKDKFPNATYVAERLLTLPTHSLVDKEIIVNMTDLIRKVMA